MIRTIKLQFSQTASGMRLPLDQKLYAMASQFAKEQLTRGIDLSLAAHVWVVCRMEGDDPVEVLNLCALQQVVDCFVFRTKPGPHATKATKKAWDRMNDFLADNGLRGAEVLLHFDTEAPEETRCPKSGEWLKKAEARPANRFVVVVK